MTGPIRLLIADDSESMRAALGALLSEYPDIAVVGQAADGQEALELARTLRPDVITMDVQMPRLSGMEAIEAIMAEAPSRILVVCAVGVGREVDLCFRAMELGAMELIAKPVGGEDPRGWALRLVEAVRLMAEVPVVTRGRRRAGTPPSMLRLGGRVAAVGIVASTGGPPALAQILGELPAGFPVPVLIAQHMAPGFMPGLLRWFSECCPLEMVQAQGGEPCRPGRVYLPPDSKDLEVDPGGLLRVRPNLGGHCPSGDRLLASMAVTWREKAAGVVLTGMGEDGARGLLEIQRAGGVTVAQNAATCVVYGMPQAAARLGAAANVLALEAIGPALRELCDVSP